MATGIDPLLYRGDQSQIYNRADKLPNKKDIENLGKESVGQNDFKNLLQEKILEKNAPANNINVSSSNLRRGLTRADVQSLIKKNSSAKKLYEATLEFESYFVEQMFREMKKNIPKNKLIDGGRAEEIFGDMLLSERVRNMSRQTEFGLAESMFQQLQGL
ncbi:MAG: rod-binding protein [Leptospirales bacterium]